MARRDDRGGRKPSVGEQSGILLLGRGLAFTLAFGIPIVFARRFTTEEFGLYKQLFLIQGIGAQVLPLGLPASLFFFVPRGRSAAGPYVGQTLIALIVLGGLGGLAVAGFRETIAAAMNNPALVPELPWLALLLALALVAIPLEPLMVIHERAGLAAATAFFSEAIRAGSMILAATVFGTLTAVLVAAAGWAALRVTTLVAYLRATTTLPALRPDARRFAEQLRFALPFAGSVPLRALADNLHLLVVAAFFDTSTFATYAVAFVQIPLVTIAFESVVDVALVRLTALHERRDLDETARLLGQTVTRLFVVLAPAWIWLSFTAEDVIVALYTERFEASVGVFRIFLLTIPLAALGLDYAPRAFGQTPFLLRVNAVHVAIDVALLLGLVPFFGPLGAALAMVAGRTITKAIVFGHVRTTLGGRTILPWRRLAAITAGGIAAAVLATLVAASIEATIPRVLVSLAAFSALYAGLVAVGPLLDEDDRTWIWYRTRRAVARAGWLRRG